MTSDRPKHFWETLGGTMTGAAALLTAITGMFLARHQLQQNSETNCPPTLSDPNPSKATETDERNRSESLSATRRTSSQPITPRKDIQLESEVIIDRQPHLVALPGTREYTFGKYIYMLLGAKLVPKTPESDALTIRMRLMNRTEQPAVFRSASFSLLNDGKAIEPEKSFIRAVPGSEFADLDILFIIPSALPSATLRIETYIRTQEIPLNLTPPGPT